MNPDPVLTTSHPICQCVDLKATFGNRYRYEWDAAYWAERSEFRAVEAPWLTIIPCKFGKIFPWGRRLLAAYCPAGGAKRNELLRLDCVKVAQGGGSEVVVTFDVADIDRVAKVMKPRRRRQHSAEELARRTTRLTKARRIQERRKSSHKSGLLGGQETRSDTGMNM